MLCTDKSRHPFCRIRSSGGIPGCYRRRRFLTLPYRMKHWILRRQSLLVRLGSCPSRNCRLLCSLYRKLIQNGMHLTGTLLCY